MAAFFFQCFLAVLLFSPQFIVSSHPHHHTPKSLHFTLFQHETVNQTIYTIVNGVKGLETNPFGTFFTFRDPIKLTADPASKLVGIAEGTSVTTSFDGMRALTVAKVTLNLERHKGSISVVGGSHTIQPAEHVVTGGTGDFMFVQGTATTSPVQLKPPAFIYKVEFHLYWPPYST